MEKRKLKLIRIELFDLGYQVAIMILNKWIFTIKLPFSLYKHVREGKE